MLVPAPQSFLPTPFTFRLTAETGVYAPDAPEVADLLRELLQPVTGLPLAAAPDSGRNVISLLIEPDTEPRGSEAYQLTVTHTGVTAVAADVAGLRWAVQTLRQLMPIEVFGEPRTDFAWTVAGARIEDAPAYAWRGFMLDVGRWYKPLAWLHTVVDLLAMHRMNIFHLHLTDDQGWRFEVERYPRLTEVGAYRRASPAGHEVDGRSDHTPHGGYYTQRELRDLVAYARRRGVTVVPEIDLPGHTQAAIAAYPELGNDPGTPVEVWTRFGVSERVLNAEESTVTFMRHVLDELVDVFPGPYVHLGGDEVPAREWRDSPAARRRIAELGLAGPEDLLGWWIGRLAEHLAGHGRRAVVWDELVGQAPRDAIVMAWRGEERIAEAIRAGHEVVATPHTMTYLNYPASLDAGEPLSIGNGQPHGPLSLSTVYGYEPAPPGALGLQGNLWTEYAATPARAEYDLMPRLAAIAEVGWGAPRDLPAVLSRLPHHLRRLDAAGVTYRSLD